MAVNVIAYELECGWCRAHLGTAHEFMAGTTPTGVVVETFFGTLHRCDTVTDEDAEAFLATFTWGPWSPARRRQADGWDHLSDADPPRSTA